MPAFAPWDADWENIVRVPDLLAIIRHSARSALWVAMLGLLAAAPVSVATQTAKDPSSASVPPASPNTRSAGVPPASPTTRSAGVSPASSITIDDVLKSFASPPRAYSPVPIWWWSGERLDIRRLEWQMDRMAEGHVYNTVILNLAPTGPLYGSSPDSPPFFSEGWWNILRRVLAKAKRIGMRIWLYDQLGFSTARIQDRLMERQPAWRAAELAVVQKDITGPEMVRMTAPGKALAACAVRLGPDGNPTGEPLHLSASLAEGRLVKQMPAGRFRIMLFYEGRGGYDYMNPTAAGKLINYVHGEFERKLKPYLGSTIPGTFQDELPPMNRWTRGFLDEFRKRKGYDLRPVLPMLWYDLGRRTAKVRCDVADVQADLLERAFFRPLYAWHSRHGMICSYDQMTRDADPIEANRYYVDYMRTMRWFQAPGNDQNGTAKPHSSIAHLYGRHRVWLEGFYNSGWGQTLEELADRIHAFYAQGANLYNPHAWYYTTLAGWWEWAPPCTSFRQPYWAHYSLFADYVSRLSYVLTRGHHVCDVAVLYPSSTVHSATTYAGATSDPAKGARDAYWAICKALEASGIDYDILDEASLLRGKAESGFLAVGSERYRCVVLPSATVLNRPSLSKLAAIAADGGIVAALGDTPSASPEYGSDDPIIVRTARALFGAGLEPLRRVGRGTVVRSERDADALANLIGGRVPAHASGVKRYLHRRVGDADVYLLIGSPTRGADKEVILKGSGVATLADPWTGVIRPLPSHPSGAGRIAVRVPFDSAHAAFVIVTPQRIKTRRPTTNAGLIPASGRIGRRDTKATDAEAKPLPPIVLDDEWRTALVPTLDNRWGDFARPAGREALPLERRRLRYREEREGEDGIAAGWALPEHTDDQWETVTAGYGLRWWISRPQIGDRPLRLPGPDDGEWRPDETVWQPAVFSLRLGIEKDPVYAQWLGPKGRVPDEFLDFGTAPTGTVRFAVTFVHVPEGRDVVIRTGVGDARIAVNGTWLPAGPLTRARLLAGYNAVTAQFRHTSAAPLRTYVHIGPDGVETAGPAWVWTDANGDVSDCYARKVIVLPEQPTWATLSITADNGYEAYVNGTRVGRDVGSGADHWSLAERYSIARYLRKGRNVIAVRGMNLGGPAGILASIRYGFGPRPTQDGETSADSLASGQPPIVTDASWKVAARAPAGWIGLRFDDGAWKPARVVGIHPCEPWGAIQSLQRSTPGVLPGSAWLNGSALPWTPDLVIDALPGMQKRVGWYRFITPPGTSRIIVPTRGRFRIFLDGRELLHNGDGRVDVPLDLQEHSQVCAIRVEQPAGRYGGGAFEEPIRFTVGIGAMKTGEWSRLGLAHYSGGVRYVQEVQIPASYVGAPLALDLGRVRGTAQVAINGKPAGVRLWRPYRFDITDLLKAGLNRIEVTVYNTLGPYFGAGFPTPYVLPGQEVSGLFGPVKITGPPAPPPAAPVLTGLTNVALAANGATARASSEHASGWYLADSVVAGHTTGERWARGGGWNDATESEFPDWLEVSLAEPAEIRAVRVLTLEPAERYGIRDFDVEVRRGDAWVTCAEVRDNEEAAVVVPVPSVRSDRVRIVIHASNDDAYSRIVAVGVYAPSPDAGPTPERKSP